jgi:hypothetical protein
MAKSGCILLDAAVLLFNKSSSIFLILCNIFVVAAISGRTKKTNSYSFAFAVSSFGLRTIKDRKL